MPAIIRLPDGTEATLLTQDGKWACADESWKRILEATTEMLPWDYYPDPFRGLAHAVAKEVDAEVVHVDPMPEYDYPPGIDN